MSRKRFVVQFNMGPSRHCPRRDYPHLSAGQARKMRHRERASCADRMAEWLCNWCDENGVEWKRNPNGTWSFRAGMARAYWTPSTAHLTVSNHFEEEPYRHGKAHDVTQVSQAIEMFWKRGNHGQDESSGSGDGETGS